MQTLRGKVRKGARRGKELGFPTANIALHKKIEEGIYLSKVTIHIPKTKNVITARQSASGGKAGIQRIGSRVKPGMTEEKWFPSVTFIGKAEMFGEKQIKAESYLLDFSGDLYGKYITVQLLKKIRDNKKFDSAEELVKQMNEDVVVAKKFFSPWC